MTSSILDGEKEKTLNVEDVFDALEEKRDRGDRRIVERLAPHSFVFSVLKAITREKSVLSNFARRLKMFFWYLHLLVHMAYGFVAKRERVPLSGTHVNNSIAETTSKARTRPTRAKGTFKEEEKVRKGEEGLAGKERRLSSSSHSTVSRSNSLVSLSSQSNISENTRRVLQRERDGSISRSIPSELTRTNSESVVDDICDNYSHESDSSSGISMEDDKTTISKAVSVPKKRRNSLMTLGTEATQPAIIGEEGDELARGIAIQKESEIVYAQVERSVEKKLTRIHSRSIEKKLSRVVLQLKQRFSGGNKKEGLGVIDGFSSIQKFSVRASQKPTKPSKFAQLFSKKFRDKRKGVHRVLAKSKCINDFELETMLGKGMVGHVFSATHKESGHRCAIKIMPKKTVVEVGKMSHVLEEKNCLISLQGAPFVARIYSAFQDEKAFYFSTELCQGDMFELFNAVGLPSIGQTKVYASQVLLGLKSIHEKGYIYRDIKPENLLIRKNGSIAIGDFGFAKRLRGNERAFTICGTPDYLSPEVLLHKGGSYASDIWAFGVLIFEMLAGYPPFRANTRKERYDRIVNTNFYAVAKPTNFDPKAELLLREIFVQDENERLDVSEIMSHPWFENLDWGAVLNGTLRPSYMFPEGYQLVSTSNNNFNRGISEDS